MKHEGATKTHPDKMMKKIFCTLRAFDQHYTPLCQYLYHSKRPHAASGQPQMHLAWLPVR